ncbi:MAG: tail tape measure protein, partial [Muribaculaceae bacterium]|nr:tail tape measure protein [Muribaculaceae bacterium]
LGQELVALQQANSEAETEAMDEGLQKKLRQIEDEFQSRKNALDKQKSDWGADNVKAGHSKDLSEEQQQAIDYAQELNEARRQKAIAEAYQGEFALMQEHLRQYGTFQQQKLAIAAEYAEKIGKAGSEAERLSLSSERDSLLTGVKAQELRSDIDWSVVFGEFGGMFTKVIEPVLTDAKAYVQTEEFKNSDQASQKALIDAIREMERNMGGADNLSFKRLGKEINDYQKAMADLRDGQDEYARCFGELQEAQKAYITAQAEGTDAEQEAAEKALATARENETAAAKNVDTLQTTAESAQRAVSNTATGLKAAMDGVVDGLQKLASGSLSGAYNGLISLGKGAEKMGGKLGKAFGKIADALEDVPIIGWIASIIDVFKDGLSVVIGGLIDAVFNAVSGILDDVLSGDLFVTLGESILSGVRKIFDAITWGGFSSWFGSGDSDKNLEKDIEYLTTSNKDLQKAIDNLAEKMEEGSVADAEEVYNRQKALLEQSMDNTQEMMQRSAGAYSNGFLGIGGQKSSNNKINNGMTSADWNRISAITGRNIRSAGAFFGLSSEDMAKVFNEANDLYTKIKSLADDGYKDAAQYMDDYIDYYRQIEELQDALREKLTGMSFNTLRDNFKSQLLDMESDAESFGENLDEMMFGTIVESLMSEKYSDMLKDWYNSLAEAMADDGKLDDAELGALRSSYRKIVDGAIAERDAIADAMGYDPEKNGSSQSGKAGSFNAMSQDQGTKLEGLFVSVQMHVTSIDEKMEDVTERWGRASDTLQRIEENTGRTADLLDDVKDDI